MNKFELYIHIRLKKGIVLKRIGSEIIEFKR